jgi:hypothetical protein
MTSSDAKVLAVDAGHATCAKSTCMNPAEASHVISGKAADVGAAHAAYVAAGKAADMGTAHAAHVAATKASAVATAAAASSGLCACGKQGSGEHCACKNHHRSSFHDILHLEGRTSRHVALSGVSQQSERRRRDRLEMGMLGCFLH